MEESQKQRTIFVVDDERVIANTLAIILRQQGFHGKVFLDGLSALSAASSCRPDILLADVAMPLMDGFELASALTTLYPSCAVLFLSGHASSCSSTRIEDYSEDWQFISKPIHPLALVPLIRALCGP